MRFERCTVNVYNVTRNNKADTKWKQSETRETIHCKYWWFNIVKEQMGRTNQVLHWPKLHGKCQMMIKNIRHQPHITRVSQTITKHISSEVLVLKLTWDNYNTNFSLIYPKEACFIRNFASYLFTGKYCHVYQELFTVEAMKMKQ